MERTILHADLNNFFASVECLTHTEWQNKPLAVAGDAEARHGIILAKNEPAKKFGIKTAMPLWQALRLCPDLICVPPHYDLYMKYSGLTREICQSYTSQVESFGPDECWMDVTASASLFGNGEMIANTLRKKIYEELGLTVSVGVSFNKVFAKLGSDMKKPNATTIIAKDDFQDIVWPLPAEALLYVGHSTRNRLHQCGLMTIGDLAKANPDFLRHILGKSGTMLWQFANGLDDAPVAEITDDIPIKSIGNSTTAYRDLTTDSDCKIVLYALAEMVSHRLKIHGLLCSTVQISIRRGNLSTYERQLRLSSPTQSIAELFNAGWGLLQQNRDHAPIRALGLRGCQLSQARNRQLSLFDTDNIKIEALENTLEEIRGKFGNHTIKRALMLKDPKLTNFKPKDHSVFLQK